MRSMLICILALSCINAYGKKSKVQPPTWWCYIGVDANKDTSTACVRDKDACELEVSQQDFVRSTTCFGQNTAAVFSITHINDGHVELDARPNMRACKAISKQMAEDSPDIIVGECVETQ